MENLIQLRQIRLMDYTSLLRNSIYMYVYKYKYCYSSSSSIRFSSLFRFPQVHDFHRLGIASEMYLLNHRLRWNNDEWLMRRLQPTREGRGSIGQNAAVLRCAMCHPPFLHFTSLSSRCNQARYSLSVWNCVVLSAPFIPDTSCGMNATMVSRRRNASLGIKGFVLLPRRAEKWGTKTGEIWIALSSCRRTTGGSLNCRNRTADNSFRLTAGMAAVFYSRDCSRSSRIA